MSRKVSLASISQALRLGAGTTSQVWSTLSSTGFWREWPFSGHRRSSYLQHWGSGWGGKKGGSLQWFFWLLRSLSFSLPRCWAALGLQQLLLLWSPVPQPFPPLWYVLILSSGFYGVPQDYNTTQVALLAVVAFTVARLLENQIQKLEESQSKLERALLQDMKFKKLSSDIQ